MLSAAQAARELGVQRRTLYAYVSRGLLPSLPVPGHPRARHYPAAAVRRLRAYVAARRDPSLGARAAARGALAWGEPVLESAITLIEPDRVYYRGYDALHLAEHATFEQVAELLWLGTPPGAGRRSWGAIVDASRPADLAAICATVLAAWPRAAAGEVVPPIAAAQAALPMADAADPRLPAAAPAAAARAGRRIVELMALLALGGTSGPRGDPAPADAERTGSGASIAGRVARAWSPHCAGASRLYDAALVLTADHELGSAALAARVVASTGGSPYAAVAAGLAALAGSEYGGDTARIAALLDEASEAASGSRAGPRALTELVARRLRRRERIPGFGHRLYPAGDPRARLLLELVRHAGARGASGDHTPPRAPDGPRRHERRRAFEEAETLAHVVAELTGHRPTVDFALVTMARVTGAPPHAPLTLFALGRAAGLIAHAIEQYRLARALRPRAQYVGPPPRASAGDHADVR